MIVMIIDRISAKTIDNQIPSTPSRSGIKKTKPSSKTKVLQKDISALIRPLFRPVKKDERCKRLLIFCNRLQLLYLFILNIYLYIFLLYQWI